MDLRLVRNGYILKFFSIRYYDEFLNLKTDFYFDFVHELYNENDNVWYLFDWFKNFDVNVFNAWNTNDRHVVFKGQDVVWSSMEKQAGPDLQTCSKCGSKKIEYVGLGVGSSTSELICPKC